MQTTTSHALATRFASKVPPPLPAPRRVRQPRLTTEQKQAMIDNLNRLVSSSAPAGEEMVDA